MFTAKLAHEPVITGQHFKIARLFRFDSPTIIDGQKMDRCDLVGPGCIFLTGIIRMIDCQFKECDFVCLKVPMQTYTAIMFRNVTLQDCVFQRCLIMAELDIAKLLPQDRFINQIVLNQQLAPATVTQH
jgi:hypothetical protein